MLKKNKAGVAGKGKEKGLDFVETKKIQDWDVVEVGLWLNSINLSQYRDVFFFNEVDGEMLADIDEDDLIAIPIERMGHRKKILRKVQMVRESGTGQSKDSSSDVDGEESNEGASHASTTKSSSSAGGVRVKCVFHDEIRTLLLRPDDTFDSFSMKVAKEFGAGYACKFRDEDGDMVTIRHTEEVLAVYSAARNGRVKLTVFSSRKKKSSGKSKKSKKSRPSENRDSSNDPEDFGVLENFVDSVIVADRKGTIQFFNAAAEDLFGYDREDLIGENVRLLMNDEDSKHHNRYLRRYRREGNSRIIGKGRKVVAKNKDGKTFDVWLSLSETDVSFTAIIQEIQGGERTYAMDKAGSSRDLSGTFAAFDNYPEPVVACNYDGFIQYANAACYQVFHHEKGSLAGVSAAVICPALTSSAGDDLIGDYDQSLSGKRGNLLTKNTRDVICYTKKGSLVAKNAEFSHRDVDGTRYFVIKLKSQEKSTVGTVMQTQRDVISTLVIPALIIDENAIVQEMNAAARDIFGYTIAHTLGHNVRMLIPPGTELWDNHTDFVRSYAATGVGRGEGGGSSVVGKGREVVGIDANGNKLNLMLSVTMTAEKTGEKIFTGILQLLSKVNRELYDSVALKQQVDVIEQLIIPACVITQDSTVRAFNKAAQELFGFSEKELVGRDVNELIPMGEIHNIHGSLVKNYADGKKNPAESVVIGKGRVVTGRHKSGHNVNVVLSVTERKDGPLVIFTGTFVVQ
jgi:PAS domain S-box-containing protein